MWLPEGLECGGAYLKLLRDTKSLHQDEFSNTTPYVIMFGPDKCGATNKVHFIFNHKNPKTGEYEEKHLSAAPPATIQKTTELYTLVVRPNNTFTVKRGGDIVRDGSLFEQFSPAINPEKEIDDPNDSKPEDWVDEARIPDPDAKKPEDWDEDAPFEIVDEEATKPEDWLEDEPLTVPDPEAQKPEDWDDEEDGDWIPPTVPNPKCADASGCGPWTKPLKKNPNYKGKWTAPYIDNPAYKGVWAPRKIKNPNYFEDKNPANFEPIGAVSDTEILCRMVIYLTHCRRLVSNSGPCRTTSSLTTSTLVTPRLMPTSLLRRLSSRRLLLRRLSRRLRSPRLTTHPSLPRILSS